MSDDEEYVGFYHDQDGRLHRVGENNMRLVVDNTKEADGITQVDAAILAVNRVIDKKNAIIARYRKLYGVLDDVGETNASTEK